MKHLNSSANDIIDLGLIKDEKSKLRASNFIKSLESLHSIDDDKKVLWLQIYENAVVDRELARELYDDVREKIIEDQIHHATYGVQATKYIERMSRANDQLIKLAEIVAEAQKDDQKIDPNSLFDKIANEQH